MVLAGELGEAHKARAAAEAMPTSGQTVETNVWGDDP